MKIEKVKIDKLVSPDYNPRVITPQALESLKRSLEEFGYIDPLVVNKHNNHVIGGNQRLEALKELGIEEVEVSYVDIKDINQEKALNIRLNNSSGEWNKIKLNNLLEELKIKNVDITLTGFEDIKIQEYQPTEVTSTETYNTDEDYDNEVQEYAGNTNDTYSEYNYDDLNDLYTEEDNIQTNIRSSNFHDEWSLTKKIFFNNPIDEDLFYKFIEKIKKEVDGETITEKILNYAKTEIEPKVTNPLFKSDFELIFRNEDEKNEYVGILYELKSRYPKSKEPLIEYIKEFENGL